MMFRFFLLIGLLVLGHAVAWGDEDPKAEILRLVDQLNAPQLAQRETAEAELLRLGPPILDLLPQVTDRTPPETRQRLGRIRQKLEQAAAYAAAQASTVTLKADGMPLSEIIESLQRQTGNTILDQRRQFGQSATDPKLTVELDETPFWPALDRVMDLAGLTLYPYNRQRAVALIAKPNTPTPTDDAGVGYAGPFRIAPLSVAARRDLRAAGSESLTLGIEVAWEPRLNLISLVQPMADVRAVDEHGDPLPVADPQAQPEAAIRRDATAVNFHLPLRLPSRDVRRIAKLQGTLLATLPGRVETFRFDHLAEAKNVEQRIAGATVVLEQVRKAAIPDKNGQTGWEVRILVRYDDAGDALASHRQWIFDNDAYLESPDGKTVAFETFETTAQSKNELGIAFVFRADRPLDGFAFVYKTPGAIVDERFNYELKNILLP